MKGQVRVWVVFTVAIAASSMLASTAAHAQSLEGTSARDARAASLEAEARGMSEQKHRWDYAASLYRAAANVREEGDPQAVRDMVYAGRLAYYLRDFGASVRDLELAARHALAGGDVIQAAHIYTDAAWVAGKAGKRRDQRALAARAQRLADSPLLTSDDRQDVLDRFDQVAVAQGQDEPFPPPQ